MTAKQVRSSHELFRECQHSERLSPVEKALDNSYGEEEQCSVTANTVYLFLLSLSRSNCKVKV